MKFSECLPKYCPESFCLPLMIDNRAIRSRTEHRTQKQTP